MSVRLVVYRRRPTNESDDSDEGADQSRKTSLANVSASAAADATAGSATSSTASGTQHKKKDSIQSGGQLCVSANDLLLDQDMEMQTPMPIASISKDNDVSCDATENL